MTRDIFLQELRSVTSPFHLQLEQNKYSSAIIGANVTLADYAAYLNKMYGVAKSFEQIVYQQLATVVSDINERFKAHLILEDLLLLNHPIKDIPTLPTSVLKEFSVNVPAALGAMYVMEGSTLGNNVLQKHLHKTLGIAVEGKLGYFTAYGSENGLKWKLFINNMMDYIANNDCGDKVIESAVNGFKLIDGWMKDYN